MSTVIQFCTAVVVMNLAQQTSMVTQECPPDIIVEKLTLPVAVAPPPPATKPERKVAESTGRKAEARKCRKGEKQWRTLKNGHRKYRIRRTC